MTSIENVPIPSKIAVTKTLSKLNSNTNQVIVPHFIFATAGYHGIGPGSIIGYNLLTKGSTGRGLRTTVSPNSTRPRSQERPSNCACIPDLVFDPIQDFWFDREEISSFMKSLHSETVILTNISKHKRRIVTHKKMKSGILDPDRPRHPPTKNVSTWIFGSSGEFQKVLLRR